MLSKALAVLLVFSLIEGVSAAPSIQVKLILNSTSSRVFLPGTGQLEFSDIPTTETEYHPQDYFLASYLNNQVKALSFSQENPSGLLLKRNSTHHFIGLNLSLPGSQAFLVFTRGDYRPVQSRMPLIRDRSFLSSPSPSFSFGLGHPVVKLLLNYSGIDISGTFTFRQGIHELTLESNRTSGRSIIIVNETIR